MRYEIALDVITSEPERGCSIVPRLAVSREGDRLCVVAVYLDDLYFERLAAATKDLDDDLVMQLRREVAVALGVERAQALAAVGDLPDTYQSDVVEVVLNEHDFPASAHSSPRRRAPTRRGKQ